MSVHIALVTNLIRYDFAFEFIYMYRQGRIITEGSVDTCIITNDEQCETYVSRRLQIINNICDTKQDLYSTIE